jgi:uncharacterized membrane protein
MPIGCLPLLLIVGLILLFPFLLANLMLAALGKLGLAPFGALLAALGIFFGGMVNIPVRRIARQQQLEWRPVRMFGLNRFLPVETQSTTYTIIAVNLGGCLIPLGLAIYELLRLADRGSDALLAALVAIGINVVVCYLVARPVPNVGIAMPTLVPPIVAALGGLLLLPGFAAPVAFTAGVLGPLVGADLLHLDDIAELTTSVASIGGAGTFDGIVISGLVATLLA